ncbi:MAG: hypothetical protein IJ677_07000 [Alphaproteobacteria bacterium]|nr:hypothetical protein [Alphaproteobacteria bacterium]
MLLLINCPEMSKSSDLFWQGVLKYITIGVLVFLFFYPAYMYRLIYPYIFAKPVAGKLQISNQDYFSDLNNPQDIPVKASKMTFIVSPKVRYAVTGKVAYVERYSTLWEKFAHGHDLSHSIYNDLSPLDLTLVYGSLANKDKYSLINFDHEYRTAKLTYPRNAISHNDLINYLNNYHIIPANKRIRHALDTILTDDTIYIEGYLSDVTAIEEPRFILKTGLRHNQWHEELYGGNYAPMCFVLYTTKIIINHRVYE